ncbi:MAG: metal ABC transporter solute-binding protein, Zn/Mn family, partial [Phycisphaerae bacterium]
EQIGGEHCDVTTLVPAGQSIHTFEPTPKQISALRSADVVFTIGLPLEDRFLAALPKNADKPRIVSLREGIALRDLDDHDHEHHDHGHDHGDKDPHFWLSPDNAIVMSGRIVESLNAISEGSHEDFAANAKRLEEELHKLADFCKAELSPFTGRQVLVFHPSYGYFFDPYEIKQIPVEIAGREPTPREISDMLEAARAANAKAILVQPQQFGRSAKLIAARLNIDTITFDPLAPDYIENIRMVVPKIARALSGDAPVQPSEGGE